MIFYQKLENSIIDLNYMDIRFITSINKNMAYCQLKGSESGDNA